MRTISKTLASAFLAAGLMAAAGGCAHNADNPVVPSSAMQVSSGNGQVAFTAPHNGVVYVRDDQDNRIVYSGDVSRNQVVKYDPNGQNVTVDDQVAASKIPGNNHDHSIYFQKTGTDSTTASGAGPVNASANTTGAGSTDTSATTQPAANVPVIRVPVGVQVEVQTQPAQR